MTSDTWAKLLLKSGAMFYLHELMKTWRYLKKVSSKVFCRNVRKEIIKMRSMRDDTYWCHFFIYGNISHKIEKGWPDLKVRRI